MRWDAWSRGLRRTLRQIDAGTVTVRLENEKHGEGAHGYVGGPSYDWGMPRYRASNGWTFEVFDDAGEWDYFQWAESPDGERRSYQGVKKAIGEYEPRDVRLWGFLDGPEYEAALQAHYAAIGHPR